jgi:hypothetical protein
MAKTDVSPSCRTKRRELSTNFAPGSISFTSPRVVPESRRHLHERWCNVEASFMCSRGQSVGLGGSQTWRGLRKSIVACHFDDWQASAGTDRCFLQHAAKRASGLDRSTVVVIILCTTCRYIHEKAFLLQTMRRKAAQVHSEEVSYVRTEHLCGEWRSTCLAIMEKRKCRS